MTTAIQALPNVERALVLLKQCRTQHEVKKIRALAQAVATSERGKLLGCEAMEIVCEADVRRAEIEGEEKAQRPKGREAQLGARSKLTIRPWK